MEVAEHVAGTFLDGADVVAVDIEAGIGLDGPTAWSPLDRLVASTPPAADHDRPRLRIDRAFALAGPGTVVTGTLTGGRIGIGDRLVIEPGRSKVRVRGLHSHGRPLTDALPGRRLALSLAGIGHHEVHRGQALVRDGQWHLTSRVDASLHVLPGLGRAVTRRGAFVGHFGSGEYPLALSLLAGRSEIGPDEVGLVRLRLPVALPLVPGDRYVLRESGRAETVGGGEILDVAPVLAPSKAAPSRSVERVVRERGQLDVDELERLTGERHSPNVGHWVVDEVALDEAEHALRARVEAGGRVGVDLALLDDLQRALIPRLPDLVVIGNNLCKAELVRSGPSAKQTAFLESLAAAPFSPPLPDDVDRAELRALEREGLIVKCEDVWFDASAVAQATDIVARLLAEHEDGVTVSTIREALGTTRRYVVPLLTHLDATGVTRRRGDLRVAGPRLPNQDPEARLAC